MQAGELDRRIVIQSATPTQDGAGQPVVAWSTVATVWAKIEALRGSEPFQGEQFNAQQKTLFTIRYRSDVTATMQITFGGEVFDVQSIVERGRHEALELTALSLVTA